MNKKKTFDCVEMKRKIQAKMYEEIRGMTHEEELEYYRRRAKEFWEKMGITRPPPKQIIHHGGNV